MTPAHHAEQRIVELSPFDIVAFVGFIAIVIGVSLYASRKQDTSEDYFLAGRNLSWWLIGFSLIASNISTEHFVGMTGAGFGPMGLAIASYEWIAAVCLVVIGLFLLPLYLRLGIYTMPEFLEHRYGPGPRAVMAVLMLLAYVGVIIAAVLYSGAIGLRAIFGLNFYYGVWLIGILAAAYTIYGGLKAVVWSDLIQGAALLIVGTIVAVIALSKVGGLGSFLAANEVKLHMILPAAHKDLPWTAFLLGIWIPNFFYWGFNQFITQRTLAAKSLAQGQRGIMFAAFLKLYLPFIIVLPGIMAFQLYRQQIPANEADVAYPVLVRNILPAGLLGLFFAALFGAIMSSLDSMLNSTSTIFTMDLYKRHVRPDADARHLIRVGRIATGVAVVAGCLIAPIPERFDGVFEYIQLVWGFVSPGVVAVFVFGLVVRRAPAIAATVAMSLGLVLYGLLLWLLPNQAFLNLMAITFVTLLVVMAIITVVRPLPEPVRFARAGDIDLTPSRGARWMGAVVILLTVALYACFW